MPTRLSVAVKRHIGRVSMTEKEPNSSSEGYVKQFLAWGSVAYACGFVIVTLHTWRLGLPVIELLHPIYIWIGLPLTLVTYFFEHIAKAFRKYSVKLADEIQRGWSQVVSPGKQDDLKIAANVVGIVKALPLGWILSKPISKFTESLIQKIEQLEGPLVSSDPQRHEKIAKYVHRVFGVFRVFNAIKGTVNLMGYALIICLGITLYVWVIYPNFPQSLGGGKPSNVI